MMISSYDEAEKPTAMLAVCGGITNEREELRGGCLL
ncbi:hypothetical protein B0H46_001313 [Clostridium saccharobutylicum]|nr:hypothetical protein [Clostridium saccharobutylicum]NYC30653.1 hypothetical protein [Clostridium saccharobutylicum]